jgi:hypothetical protein
LVVVVLPSALPSATAFAIPAPALISPVGTISTPTPEFRWHKVPAATNYLLEINTPTGNLYRGHFPASTSCPSTICVAAPGVSLVSGSYSWAVQSQNGSDKAWSDSLYFTVPPPPAPGLVSPSGALFTPMPTYVWNTVTGAVLYYVLEVEPAPGTVGTPYFNMWYTPGEACSGSTCSVTPSLPQHRLAAGTYLWRVRVRTSIEAGPWSGQASFSPQGPPMPYPLTPNGPGTTVSPTFTWTAVVGGNVTGYRLSVQRDGGPQVYSFQYDLSGCSGGLCVKTPAYSLPSGWYRWDVVALNSVGPSVVAGSLPFTVTAPAPPTPLSPQGLVPTPTPTFSWAVSPGAMGYSIRVTKLNGATVYETAVGNPCNANSVCTFTPPHALTVGTSYLWHVRGAHTSGIGEWSFPVDIRVASPYLDGDCAGDLADADFDGNGHADRLCRVQTIVYVALATGAGGYGHGLPWLTYAFTRLLVGDFDGDGRADLADVKEQTGEFLVARSTGSSFQNPASWGIARATWSGTSYTCMGTNIVTGVGSFNGDARMDVYCLDSSIRLFRGLSTGTSFQFSIPDVLPPGVVPTQEYIYSGSRPLAITGAPPQ